MGAITRLTRERGALLKACEENHNDMNNNDMKRVAMCSTDRVMHGMRRVFVTGDSLNHDQNLGLV